LPPAVLKLRPRLESKPWMLGPLSPNVISFAGVSSSQVKTWGWMRTSAGGLPRQEPAASRTWGRYGTPSGRSGEKVVLAVKRSERGGQLRGRARGRSSDGKCTRAPHFRTGRLPQAGPGRSGQVCVFRASAENDQRGSLQKILRRRSPAARVSPPITGSRGGRRARGRRRCSATSRTSRPLEKRGRLRERGAASEQAVSH